MATSRNDPEYYSKTPRVRLSHRQRPVYEVLGGGQVADLLLWKNKALSASLMTVVTAVWFLFEVAGYNLVTLICHIVMTSMLVIFIWSSAADILKWAPPSVPHTIGEESTFIELARTFYDKSKDFMPRLLLLASELDLKSFILSILCLYVLSVIGNSISTLNLIFIGLVCLETLPFLYSKYEEEVDILAGEVYVWIRNMYRVFDSNILEKIPRGPVKEKKTM